MANRPTGSAPRQRQAPAPSTQPQPHVRHSTARVAVHEPPRSPLPGWFWGALGCLSVLSIGLAVLFVATKPGAEEAAPVAASAPAAAPPSPGPKAVVAAPAPARPAPGAPARAGGIHVEQIAAPPPPALAEMPRPKARPPRAVKVAKTPSAAPKTAAPADGVEEADEAELLAPRAKRAATARAADEEESEEKSP